MDQFPGLREAEPWVWVGFAGMIGRLMYHAKLVQAGKRKPFSWALLWDIPIALGMGWVAYGITSIVSEMPWQGTISMAMIAAYLGPYGVDTVFSKWADSKFGPNKEGKTNGNVAD